MNLDSRLSECECQKMSLNPPYIGKEGGQTFVWSVGLLTRGGESWLSGNTEVTSAPRFVRPTLTCEVCVHNTVDTLYVQGPRGNIIIIYREDAFQTGEKPSGKDLSL